ncbi:ABC transporter ATP-binding protein [Mesorhizobium muleiense]|uniref:ABC transporter ATP-binding protein n=1 Tax=Mesorhizobium muleiense TaxID=1004279 RepID=UPI001F3C4D9F|nr:ABC transporter ATP-binding protein [Mesorhizobium muleiense]MCF6110379.1 ABC transporter ATP-binding protein [Mesorhizobium muleiense]
MADPVLSIKNLRIVLPEGADRDFAVDDVSFDLHAGEVLCIVGESGSGKSMSANAAMGLLPDLVRPVAGSIRFGETDLLTLSDVQLRDLRGRKLAMIFQEPMSALNPLMRVEDQIAEVFEAHDLLTPGERSARAIALLSEVGIPDPEKAARAYPFQLSGGQRQRVMIAMALALEPQILIADEPTTALDVTTQAQILKLIANLQEKHGMAVLFITHDFGVVAEIADRVAVMQYGKIVETGTADDVLDNPQHAYTQKLIAAIPRFAADAAGEGRTQTPILEVEGLNKTYRTGGGLFGGKARVVEAVKNVNLTLGEGETLGIVGESGSGKSSVGRCLVRLMTPDSGTVRLAGQDMAQLSGERLRAARKSIQMIFQDPYASLNPRSKIGRIIAEGPIAHGVPKRQAYAQAVKLLELVDLDAVAIDRYPHEFSGGQRQRIGIARALALEPRVIIADEAVSALDVSIQAQVLELLAELKERLNLALVFITHDLRVAAQICDRIAVMKKGEVVEIGPAHAIFNNPQNAYTRTLIEAIPGRERELAEGGRALPMENLEEPN